MKLHFFTFLIFCFNLSLAFAGPSVASTKERTIPVSGAFHLQIEATDDTPDVDVSIIFTEQLLEPSIQARIVESEHTDYELNLSVNESTDAIQLKLGRGHKKSPSPFPLRMFERSGFDEENSANSLILLVPERLLTELKIEAAISSISIGGFRGGKALKKIQIHDQNSEDHLNPLNLSLEGIFAEDIEVHGGSALNFYASDVSTNHLAVTAYSGELQIKNSKIGDSDINLTNSSIQIEECWGILSIESVGDDSVWINGFTGSVFILSEGPLHIEEVNGKVAVINGQGPVRITKVPDLAGVRSFGKIFLKEVTQGQPFSSNSGCPAVLRRLTATNEPISFEP